MSLWEWISSICLVTMVIMNAYQLWWILVTKPREDRAFDERIEAVQKVIEENNRKRDAEKGTP